jgi:hypothetical protein
LIANGGEAIRADTGAAIVRVSNSTVANNTTGLLSSGAAMLLSRSNNTVQGNATKGAFTGTFTAD